MVLAATANAAATQLYELPASAHASKTSGDTHATDWESCLLCLYHSIDGETEEFYSN